MRAPRCRQLHDHRGVSVAPGRRDRAGAGGGPSMVLRCGVGTAGVGGRRLRATTSSSEHGCCRLRLVRLPGSAGASCRPRGRGSPRRVAFYVLRPSRTAVAMTGTEAISNGVSVFAAPQARNARTTLCSRCILGDMFLGVSCSPRRRTPCRSSRARRRCLGDRQLVYGRGPALSRLQAATAVILSAANTSYTGPFSSFVARTRSARSDVGTARSRTASCAHRGLAACCSPRTQAPRYPDVRIGVSPAMAGAG